MSITEAVKMSRIMASHVDSGSGNPEYDSIVTAGKALAAIVEDVYDPNSAGVAMAAMADTLMGVAPELDAYTSKLLIQYGSAYFYAANILFNK